jgi:UDP-N-acetylglucosamine 3-dehydrogenase
MRPIRYAVVGCGGIANNYHLKAMTALDDGQFVVACDLVAEKARETTARYGAQTWTTDYRRVLERDDVDLVCVFTKIEAHAEIAVAAAEAGKHVFVQKPLARTLCEGQVMVDAAAQHGVLLRTSFMHSYFDESLAAAEWVRSGRIGAIEFVRQRNATNNPRWTVPSFGGAMMDIGAHGVDLIRTVLGQEIVRVLARIDADVAPPPGVAASWDSPRDRPLSGGEANAFLLYELSGGAMVSHEVQWSARGGTSRFQLEIYGTAGSILVRVPRTGELLAVSTLAHPGTEDRKLEWHVPALPERPMGQAQHRALFDAVRAGQVDDPGGHGLAVLRTFAAARRSAETGAWAEVE